MFHPLLVLGSSMTVTRSQTSLVLLTLTILSRAGWLFYRLRRYWDLSDIFVVVKSRFWSFGRKSTEVKHHSYYT